MKIQRFGVDTITFDPQTAITVGTFDGVHCGHQGIIASMKASAVANNERTVAVTFDPHPQIVLAKEGREPLQLLTSIDERCELLEYYGVDLVVVIPFTMEFANTSAEEFIRKGVVESIGVQHFFIGHDHSFGKDRGGNEELLQRLGGEIGFSVRCVPPLECNGSVVSSTKIRLALRSGKVADAQEMLGRPYSIRGRVQQGAGRGRTLGIPTANIAPTEVYKLVPAHGVYVVSSVIDGAVTVGMANIGVRPTFTQDTTPILEVHFLDLEKDLYGRVLDVKFHHRLRNEQKFASAEAFLSQLEQDKEQTQHYQQLIIERSLL